MITAVFTPGESVIHRATPGSKILALLGYAILLSSIDTTVLLLLAVSAVPVLWRVAGLSWVLLRQSLQPAAWILLMIFAFQVFVAGLGAALHVVLTLCALIGAAALISATTRTDDMLDTVQHALMPLGRFGFPVKQVGFALVFVIRLIPFVSLTGRAAIEARIARGASGNMLPAVVPTIIRLMRESDAMAEALVARGFGRI
jgi:biotin transport system permease protein